MCVYTHHIWRPQGGSSHGAGPWATDIADFYHHTATVGGTRTRWDQEGFSFSFAHFPAHRHAF